MSVTKWNIEGVYYNDVEGLEFSIGTSKYRINTNRIWGYSENTKAFTIHCGKPYLNYEDYFKNKLITKLPTKQLNYECY